VRNFSAPGVPLIDANFILSFSQLSIFENDKFEFVVPEVLYTWRLQSLERALRDRDCVFEGLKISLYYGEPAAREDSEMKLYPATVLGVQSEDLYHDAHLQGSGFGVVEVDCAEYTDLFSSWEVNADENGTLSRPRLSEEEKKVILDGLNEQLRKPDVKEYLAQPVDQVRYCDYSKMVEVSLDLMFIKRRLDSDYYASKLSVVSDVRLIRDNSIKYNGIVNDLSRVASEMYDEFERRVLSEEERSQILTQEDFDNAANGAPDQGRPSVRIRLRPRSDPLGNDSAPNEPAYSLRNRGGTRRQSALETLPGPEEARDRRRSLRNELGVSSGQRRSTRSREAAQDTEVLGRISRNRSNEINNATEMDAEQYSEEEDTPQVPQASHSRADENSFDEGDKNADEDETSLYGSEAEADSRLRRSSRPTKRSRAAEEGSEKETPQRARSATRTNPRRGDQARSTTRRRLSRSMPSFEDGGDHDNSSDEDGAKESVSEQEDDNWKSVGRNKTTTRSGRVSSTRHAAAPESPSRRSNRNPAAPIKSYEEGSSEVEMEEDCEEENPPTKNELPSDYEEEEKSEEEVKARPTTTRRRAPTTNEFPSDYDEEEGSEEEFKAPSRPGRRRPPTNTELPSDYDEEEVSEEEVKAKSRPTTAKRQRGKSNFAILLFDVCGNEIHPPAFLDVSSRQLEVQVCRFQTDKASRSASRSVRLAYYRYKRNHESM
jgi:hypothetical protein